MSETDERLDLLERALDQTRRAIAGARPDQAGLPTPCRSCNLRQLVNHVVQDARFFAARLTGEDAGDRDADVLDDDWAASYGRAADGLMEAWRRPGQVDGTISLPFGEVPATWSVDQQVANFAVHGWDVAKATGQPIEFDPEVGRAAMAFGRENLKPEFRGEEGEGKSFGPEVAVEPDAPLYDQVAAVFGRDPSEWEDRRPA